jgi:hypothetical protein
MKIKLLNWSNALEILEHKSSMKLLDFVKETVKDAPHFLFKGKSESNSASNKIDTCQEHLNCYFDYKLYENGWDIQPFIGIGENNDDKEPIKLKADFRKTINNRFFQIEVQCGNNSRFYADLVKFQMAWLQKLTDVAILIVPMNNYALRIGENICNYERLERELPYLRNVLQLPILVIGFEPDKTTTEYDLKKMGYSILSDKNKKDKAKYAYIKKKINRDRNIQAIFTGIPLKNINDNTPVDKSIIPKRK